MILILWGILVAALFYIKIIRPYSYWSDRGVKQRQQTYFFGDLAGILFKTESVWDAFHNMYNAFPEERYIGIYQLLTPTILLRDPDLIKQILVKDFDHFTDHRQFVPDGGDDLWSKNLLALKGNRWRDIRSTVTPSFTTARMKLVFSLVSECAADFNKFFLESVKDVEIVELKDVFSKFTNDVIATVAFGIKIDSLREPENEFYMFGKEATSFEGVWKSISMFLFILAPELCKVLGVRMFRKEIATFFKRVIKETIELREQKGITRPDMLQLLMEARTKREEAHEGGKEKITDSDIAAQAMIFFFGGFESVSNLMSFMGYELAVNPEVQLKLQKEIDETLEECKGVLTYETLLQMKYMDMVVSETLRKWPVIVASDRVCTKPYTIQPTKSTERPVHIKEGGLFLLPITAIHWDQKFFPQPERFDPERFNEENKSSINSYAYIPFGVGPRNCIGTRFALLELKTIFFHLLSKFELVVVEKTQIPLKISKKSGNLTVENGFWVGLKLRT